MTMYRQTDDRKVWYEWMLEVFTLERTATSGGRLNTPSTRGVPAVSPGAESVKNKEHNQQKANSRAGYRRVRVGMSDLHSSIKDGCLM